MRIGMIGLKGVPFPAGIENFTEQVGYRLVERGHEVVVYCRPYVDVTEHYRGMLMRRIPSINTKHLDALTHTALATIRAVFDDLDIIHYHALGPSVFSLITRLSGMHTVTQVHGLDYERAKWSPVARRCLKAAEYGAVYFPHRAISVSRTVQRDLERRYGRPVSYVPTGVDFIDDREPREIARWGLDKDSYVLFLSRLVPEKGCHHLIRAFQGVRTSKKLVVAGPATHPASYARALQRNAHPNIVFTGAVTGRVLEELFSNAYVFVLPSEIEGLSHALLQALAAGRCVLASDIEPNIEALGGCGLTFRNRDVDDLRLQLQSPAR